MVLGCFAVGGLSFMEVNDKIRAALKIIGKSLVHNICTFYICPPKIKKDYDNGNL